MNSAEPPPRLRGEALKQAGRRLVAELQAKIEGVQQGVGTFADHTLLDLIGKLERFDRALPWEDSVAQVSRNLDDIRLTLQRLQLLLTRRAQGRFVDYQERSQSMPRGVYGDSDLNHLDLSMSQGAFHCMQWKGMPLFKTAYDFSIYTMLLWALRPATIIELGAGAGASAIWLADLATTFWIDSTVYSVDVRKPDVEHDRVSFIEGDCTRIDTVFEEKILRNAAHPWLIIEDAHVNVYGVLSCFHPYIVPGDYVVVEDSAGKQEDIGRFLEEQPGRYKVDTHYTDFFGRNVTCAPDSILVRV